MKRFFSQPQFEDEDNVLTKFTAFWGIGFPLVVAILTGTVAWANTQSKLEQQENKIEQAAKEVTELKKSLNRTERNIIRIGGKMNVSGLEDPE